MQQKTLLQEGEALRFSQESHNFPMAQARNVIFQREQNVRRTLLGHDFWALLEASLVEYTNIETWSAQKTYSLDDYVDYFGLVLRSTTDNNTVNPCEDNPDPEAAAWVNARKFDNDCYEALWHNYLGPFLTGMVMPDLLISQTYRAGANGVTVSSNDATGTSSASLKVVDAKRTSTYNLGMDALENMKAYMMRVNALESTDAEYCDFSKVKFVKSCDLHPVERRGRRMITRGRRSIPL